MRGEIRFLRRGKVVKLSGISPTLTLLDHLRLTVKLQGLDARLTGVSGEVVKGILA